MQFAFGSAASVMADVGCFELKVCLASLFIGSCKKYDYKFNLQRNKK